MLAGQPCQLRRCHPSARALWATTSVGVHVCGVGGWHVGGMCYAISVWTVVCGVHVWCVGCGARTTCTPRANLLLEPILHTHENHDLQ